MKGKRKVFVIMGLCLVMLSGGCGSNKMKDGYYTAEMADYSHGWKEYVCICVKNDRIISAEYNAKDANGFIKAWDNEYMHNMMSVSATGMYPNKYTREYVQQLLDGQKETQVDVLSGASESGSNFKKLVAAVIAQAQNGDPSAAVVSGGE